VLPLGLEVLPHGRGDGGHPGSCYYRVVAW
jgi:hypothetical protein